MIARLRRSFSRRYVVRMFPLFVVFAAVLPLIGQTRRPIKVSLEKIGHPQFPTGFWVTNSDPHFRHIQDSLFWLSADRVATVFLKDSCCDSATDNARKFAAATFDLRGKTIATHEWAMSTGAIGGTVGGFWVRRSDAIDVLAPNFTLIESVPIPPQATVIWSRSGRGMAVQNGETAVLYNTTSAAGGSEIALPSNAKVVDIYGRDALVMSSRSRGDCEDSVLRSAASTAWKVKSVLPAYSCEEPIALLSSDEVLVNGWSPDSHANTLKVVRRDGTAKSIQAEGQLFGTIASDRLLFLRFRRNRMAEALDMDFGGTKDINVIDLSSGKSVFRKKLGGQAGAALSPDGNHVAIIEGHELLIYTLP